MTQYDRRAVTEKKKDSDMINHFCHIFHFENENTLLVGEIGQHRAWRVGFTTF